MPEMQPIPINIDNVNDGAMREAFDAELRKVMANINDVNTPATSSREITLKLKLKPHSDRTEIETLFTCSSRLASIEPHPGRMFMGADTEGNLYGFQDDPRQQVLFEPPAKPENKVVNFTPTK